MNEAAALVLIVDDEIIIRKSLEFYLEDEGFNVMAVETAEDALKIIEKHPVEIGIFDMNIPDMDGNTLIMKAKEIRPHMRCIIHTGSSNYVIPTVLKNIGITSDDVFIKPILDINVLGDYLHGESRTK